MQSRHERTFIAVKPDGVQRGLAGEIIHRFERKGYKLVGMKLVQPTLEQARGHYADLSSRNFYSALCEYFSSGPICAMVWEGMGVIQGGRTLLGATNPAESAPGTIRGDLCVQTGRNVCHGSDGPVSAAKEIAFWFKPEEILSWESYSITQLYES